ncbi:MAG: hypothetical protein KBD01_08310 [Acidobacteria bacterium]|nr:hypothetical protein [Acidobacteriota bacterium]
MTRLQKWLLWGPALLSAATGLAYAAMKYLGRADEFSAYGHPWQPHALVGHLLVSPAILFAVGWIFGVHALVHLRTRADRRRTGWALIGLIAPMVLTGYLLQAASGPAARAWLGWAHATSSCLFLGVLAVHAFARRGTAEPRRGYLPVEPRSAR